MAIIGGVTQKHAIKFLVQLAFGEKTKEVYKAEGFETLVMLCLRQSWGPAFSHVSENTKKFDIASDSKKEEMLQNCIKNLYGMYCTYFKKDKKSEYLCDNDNVDEFKGILHDCKEKDSTRNPIGIGHFQKLFNMTTKYLLALYLLRGYIWDNGGPFAKFDEKDIKDFFENADCPIDSKILDKVYTKQNLPANKWSKFNETDYCDVQDEISQKVYPLSNLFYDFENW